MKVWQKWVSASAILLAVGTDCVAKPKIPSNARIGCEQGANQDFRNALNACVDLVENDSKYNECRENAGDKLRKALETCYLLSVRPKVVSPSTTTNEMAQ